MQFLQIKGYQITINPCRSPIQKVKAAVQYTYICIYIGEYAVQYLRNKQVGLGTVVSGRQRLNLRKLIFGLLANISDFFNIGKKKKKKELTKQLVRFGNSNIEMLANNNSHLLVINFNSLILNGYCTFTIIVFEPF